MLTTISRIDPTIRRVGACVPGMAPASIAMNPLPLRRVIACGSPGNSGRSRGTAQRVHHPRSSQGDFMNPSANTALDASVLVLNKLFMAIHVISVRRAFCLLAKDLAEVVSLEEGQFTTYDFSTWREVSEYRSKNF